MQEIATDFHPAELTIIVPFIFLSSQQNYASYHEYNNPQIPYQAQASQLYTVYESVPVETSTHYQYPHHFHGTYTPPQGYPTYYSPLQVAPDDKSYLTPFISPSASSSSAATPSVDVDSINITPPTAESQSSSSPKCIEVASEYFLFFFSSILVIHLISLEFWVLLN